MKTPVSRRKMLAQTGVCLGATAAVLAASADEPMNTTDSEPFGYCLNTGTLMGHKLSAVEEIEIVAEAGWQGIEFWIRNLQRHVEQGGSVSDLKKRLDDHGIQMVSAIGFPRWAVDDDTIREKSLEQFRHEMHLVTQLGGNRIACPPAGINQNPNMNLRLIAERYQTVLELGRKMGVIPQLEIWGSAKTLGTLADAIFVAIETADPDACLLLDVFHLFKGGSGFESLSLLNGAAMHLFHLNDYPADPPRNEINDSHRIYPGDGIAPLSKILQTLASTGFRGMLSLELFNRDYWQKDALTVAKLGLEKTRCVVQTAMSQQRKHVS